MKAPLRRQLPANAAGMLFAIGITPGTVSGMAESPSGQASPTAQPEPDSQPVR